MMEVVRPGQDKKMEWDKMFGIIIAESKFVVIITV
jgi:hypothetical protein